MKVLRLIIILIGTSSFAQTELFKISNNQNPLIVSNSQEYSLCTISETDSEVDTGFGNVIYNEVADNFIVTAGERFTAKKVTIRVIANTGTTFSDVTVRFYANSEDGNVPASNYLSQEVVIPTSQVNLGAVNSSFDGIELELDIAPVELASVDESDTTYWISVWIPNSPSAYNFVETTNETTDTTSAHYRRGNDQTTNWSDTFLNGDIMEILDRSLRVVIEGDCSPVLGIEDNITQLFSVYPNPTSSVFTISSQLGVQIQDVVLYDIYGKNTQVSSINNEKIDVSFLSSGVYILHVTTDRGVVMKKITKQ